jgi:opacity protein-like surface antigen
MKKLALILTTLALSSSIASAGFYLRAGTFYASPESINVDGIARDYSTALDSSMGFNACVGFKLSVLRIEAEFNYMDSNIKDVDIAGLISSGKYERASFFANVLFEIPFTPLIEPYVGVGVGLSNVSVDFRQAITGDLANSFSSSADNMQFSVQAMAGLRFSLFDTVSIYAGYRYINADALTFTDNNYQLKAQGGSHVFEVGVGLGF